MAFPETKQILKQDMAEGLINPEPTKDFVETPFIKELTSRALKYLQAGFPVHFQGPTGVGKTTLALHMAHLLNQPVIMLHGDDQFSTKDLAGESYGISYKKLVDEFVRGVSKREESITKNWVDHRLTVAVRNGYTLFYDEFSRSRPEANNILLSVLQEGIMDIPVGNKEGDFISVHPQFKAIFTSNPEEYAGVHKAQDALLDRMVTIDLGHYDKETEIEITAAKSGLSREEAEKIINIVRGLRKIGKSPFLPTIRGAIMTAKSVKEFQEAKVSKKSLPFRQVCYDVLLAETIRNEDQSQKAFFAKSLDRLINKYCPTRGRFLGLFKT